MRLVEASAPGKVLLFGEYAVLDGAPAIAMAVDRRARVRLAPSRGATSTVRAIGFDADEGVFGFGPRGLEWSRGGGAFGIVDAAFATASSGAAQALAIELDTAAFLDAASRRKYGLGSSAALTVALVAALGADDVLGASLRAHRAFQGGAGSGVDVAVAVAGGLLEYRMEGPVVRPMAWPAGLAVRVVWAGVPADTRAKLDRLATSPRSPSRAALGAAADGMARAWRAGDTGAILGSAGAYVDALQRFDVDHGLGIFEAGHGALVERAASAGLAYKPSGAGGGDVGVLFGDSERALDAFVDELGLDVVDCRLERDGYTVECE